MTMFNCSRPTRRRLYLQPMFSFRAVNAWVGRRQAEENGRSDIDSRPRRKY